MIKRRSHGQTATASPAPGRRNADTPGSDAPKGDPVTERIGRELRKMFDTVVAEHVPEKFRRLIDDLKDKGGKS